MGAKLGCALCNEKDIFNRSLNVKEMDRKEFFSPINSDVIKKYYAWNDKSDEKDLSWKLEKTT